MSAEPVHVGSLFFKTKESLLGGEEEALLKELAVAYAGYARRNLATPGGERGLKGRVVGYADPRRSVEPDNRKLSAARAVIVARRLTRLLAVESGLIEGNFDIKAEAGGVAAVADEPGPELEANSLAPYRRVDVFLEGGFIAPAPAPLPPPTAADPKPEPPPMKELEHDWDKFDPYIDRVDKEDIRAMAIRMYSALGVGATARGGSGGSSGGKGGGSVNAGGVVGHYWNAIGLRIDLYHRERRAELPSGITLEKPSWWDGLAPPRPSGRGALAKRNVLQEKARLLKIWYLTTIKYGETYMLNKGGVLTKALAEARSDHPNAAKLWEYAKLSGQYAYMVDATVELSKEVMQLAK